ncbi:MAG: heme-binding protein, partial [Oleibacter sp.]|nr:heme-binding protein [Thalassolituus sp.]
MNNKRALQRMTTSLPSTYFWAPLGIALFAATLAGCGGGEKADNSGTAGGNVSCAGNCQQTKQLSLSINDVETVIAQAVNEAKARNAKATVAVVDRVGNVLGVYRMTGATETLKITTTSGTETAIDGGLEQLELPSGADALAAIAKAITGAYLATEGNGFSTRTAGQIIQDHFNPGERNQPGGPLFGVQFSQLPCSDFSQRDLGTGATSPGPHRSPLGLSADPGGFPLYKEGIAVGGVGVISDGRYSLDKNLLDVDTDQDELIALAASFGYQPPLDRRADRITVDGKILRFSDVDNSQLSTSPNNAPAFSQLSGSDGALLAVTGYTTAATRAGTVFGQAGSGVRADTGLYANQDAFVFVDGSNNNRYPPIAGSAAAQAGTAPLTSNEVQTLIT